MNELADVFAELDDPRAVNARRQSALLAWVPAGAASLTWPGLQRLCQGWAARLGKEQVSPGHPRVIALPLSKLKCLCAQAGILRCPQNDRSHDSNLEEPLPHRSHPLTCEIRKTYNLRGRLLRNGQKNISTQKAPPRSRPWLSFPLGHIRRPGRSAAKAVQGPPQAERLIPDA